jgi:hypothetical protein
MTPRGVFAVRSWLDTRLACGKPEQLCVKDLDGQRVERLRRGEDDPEPVPPPVIHGLDLTAELWSPLLLASIAFDLTNTTRLDCLPPSAHQANNERHEGDYVASHTLVDSTVHRHPNLAAD